jgi:hypothetical protein
MGFLFGVLELLWVVACGAVLLAAGVVFAVGVFLVWVADALLYAVTRHLPEVQEDDGSVFDWGDRGW